MILVAATATGLALARQTLELGPIFAESPPRTLAYNVMQAIRYTLLAGLPFLLTWTPALVVIRLLPPRPSLRRVARQPGFVACVVASLALCICCIHAASMLAKGKIQVSTMSASAYLMLTNFVTDSFGDTVTGYTPEVGFAVGGAWLAQVLNGCWRPNPGWIDRAGRALGFGCLIANVLNWLWFYLL
jgi:hypothetical protein